MSQQLQSQPTLIDVAELKKLFGPPPILSTESKQNYEAMENCFIEAIQPEDFVVLMLVKDLAVSECEILRLQRHKTWAIDRGFRKRLKNQEIRKAVHERRTREMASRAEDLKKATTEADRLAELEYAVDDVVGDVNRTLDAAAEERDHAQGLEDAFEYYERLDRALSVAFARRNDGLEQISRYRADLGERLRKKCAIIEGEFKTLNESTDTQLAPSQSEA